MRRAVLGGVLVALLLLGAAFLALRSPAVQDRLIERFAARLVARSADALLEEDALRVLLCGTSSPFPGDRAGPCTAVFAGGSFWVVDVGQGSTNNLLLWRVPGRRIGGVLLTHFHSDHIGALGELDLQTWVDGRPGPLRVFGPPGVERVVAGFEEAYAQDAAYRTAHHGAALLPPDVGRMEARPVDASAGPTVVLEEGGLRITAFPVDHRPVEPAQGYRFEYGGRSVVVSGDTVKDARLVEAARGADVLVHEAQSNHLVALLQRAAEDAGRSRVAKIFSDIPSYHTTPVEAAEIANEAGVDLLVFTHLTPPPPNRLVELAFLRGVADVRPEGWVLGEDGLLVELPTGSDAVEIRSIR